MARNAYDRFVRPHWKVAALTVSPTRIRALHREGRTMATDILNPVTLGMTSRRVPDRLRLLADPIDEGVNR